MYWASVKSVFVHVNAIKRFKTQLFIQLHEMLFSLYKSL